MTASPLDVQALLDSIAEESRPFAAEGRVASYIPRLGAVDPKQFGMAYAPCEGDVVCSGDARVPFSVQSISKAFALMMVLAADAEINGGDGGAVLWKRVGREPSGTAFNSLVQLEYEQGIPRNPFLNAGALVVVDRLLTKCGDAFGALREFVRQETGHASLDCDAEVAASEAAHGDRNAALAHFLASYGNLENPVDLVLDHYFRQCALAMTCADIAKVGLVLARHGRRADGTALLDRSGAKRVNSLLLTCGTYDAAGEFAYRVGLPGKSGVGGGILAILPERGSLCVWGPALDKHGNSVAGVEALDRFTTRTGWSVF